MHLILVAFCLACILPFVFVVIISFSSQDSIRELGFSFTPKSWALDAYTYVAKLGQQLWISYFNSFFITIVGTLCTLLVTGLYAYALYRKDFKFRRFFTFFCFFTMIFGGGLAPTYVICKQFLGLSDSYAAAIDGSGEYHTLFRIVVPIAKPGIATVGLLSALAYWNEWFIPMLYIRDSKYYPLQYLLQEMQSKVDFLSRNSSVIGAEAAAVRASLPSDTLRMALVVLIVIPIAFAYPFFQRYIISGLTIGSVKG